MKPFKISRALVAVATVAALVTGVVNPAQAHRPAHSARAGSNVLILPEASQVLWVGSMDPSLITSALDQDVVQKIYAGLVKEVYDDATGKFKVVPDLAAGMPTISKDGLVYTFKIRPDAKFSDGTPVTAQDVIWSYTRVVDPKAQSGAAYYMYPIKGASDYANGKAKSVSGLKALDDHTVQITLAAPAGYFLYDMNYNTFYIVKHTLPVGAPMTTTPSLVVGAGPWMLKGGTWNYRSKITLVPNPYYYDSKNFKLKEIDVTFTGTYESMVAAYKSGQFPIAWLPSADVATYKGQPEFHSTVVEGDTWLVMNVTIKPFDNIHFRRAVAYAINRDAIVNGVLHGTTAAQLSWYPQGILGFDPNVQNQSGVPHYDPNIAKSELAMAMKQMSSVPPITLEFRSELSDVTRTMAEIQSELKAIGINITLHPVPRATWIKDGNSGKTQFIWSDWYMDYPDPQDFSDYLIITGAPENWGRYSNPTVDRLVARADATSDAGTREKLYKQAQLIILREAPVAMLTQFAQQSVISTKVHGMELNPQWGTQPQPVGNDWANVTVSS